MDNTQNKNRIVLFAKKPGLTSFSSLFTIKHAFNTSKVGHTGTLDSFASGLLVVCTGALTRLAGRITEFNKTYEAVIKFGQETDTLECTGSVIKTAPLPDKEAFENALKKWTGELMQVPPVFSAIHLDGKRASDLVRSGKEANIPPRKITVYSSVVKELQLDELNKVLAARVEFSVSKGTYIRSLARDIAKDCGSAGHLVGLLRTRIASFDLKNAAGFSTLEEFTIKNAFKQAEKTCEIEKVSFENKKNKIHVKKEITSEELQLQKECLDLSLPMTRELSLQCGFGILILKDEKISLFDNGVKLRSDMFTTSPFEIKEDIAAVFTEMEEFKGLLEKNEKGYFSYAFVVH